MKYNEIKINDVGESVTLVGMSEQELVLLANVTEFPAHHQKLEDKLIRKLWSMVEAHNHSWELKWVTDDLEALVCRNCGIGVYSIEDLYLNE